MPAGRGDDGETRWPVLLPGDEVQVSRTSYQLGHCLLAHHWGKKHIFYFLYQLLALTDLMHFNWRTHPIHLDFLLPLIWFRVGLGGGWSFSQLSQGKRQGTLWTGPQVSLRDRRPLTLTLTRLANLDSQINITLWISSDCLGKLDYPREDADFTQKGPRWPMGLKQAPSITKLRRNSAARCPSACYLHRNVLPLWT